MIINFLPVYSHNTEFKNNKNHRNLQMRPPLRKDNFEKNIAFMGLTRDLGKKLYDDESSIKEASIKHPRSRSVAGSIPPEWVEKIPKEQRKEKIPELYTDFKDVIYTIRKYEYSKKAEKKASKKLTKAFVQAGIINKKEIVTLEKLGRGSSGYGYLIKGLSEKPNYVLKVYHDNTESRQTGRFIETNRAMYWKKNAGQNTQRVEFFFADMASGYMVTKYINEETKPPKKHVNPLLLGIIASDDMGDNRIGKHYIDYGYLDKCGLTVDKDDLIELNGILAENKDARFVFKKIYKSEDKEKTWTEFFNDPKYKNSTGIKVGLLLTLGFVENPNEKYQAIYETSQKTINVKDYYIIKKALADKIEFAPQDKVQDYCSNLLMAGEEIVKILRTKTHQIKNPDTKSEINNTLDNYYKMFIPYQY